VVELFGPFEKKFDLFFSELQQLFINDLVTSLFARFYRPDEELIQAGSNMDSVLFIMKGQLAICEPNGDPFCILVEGNNFGEFQVIYRTPCFYRIRTGGDF
jgi:signal-transduction protein with cAMP-binding, CBS, and nucleotidyltransferase domain